ncbi:MAG TPA: M20/M25/M40 family metallo-hydrolase [Chloroflexota bacterium]|jgi:acetylornithine deacetylase/succinyl-diaminopimelate desuccinylase-like protein
MPFDKAVAQRVLAGINPDDLAQLGVDLVNCPSPTGQEAPVAEYMLDWFQRYGLKAIRQEVDPGRPNAIGILKGSGGGLSLMFNGHTDTSFTGTAEDLRMIATLEPDELLKGSIKDGKVYGLGISNMKGGVAAFMVAAKAIKDSGVKLPGDVILAGVVGEISRTPIGPWQSQNYRGEGAGTRHLLTHGIQSDYAVVADGSDLNIVWAQTGVVQIKITVFGTPEAAWGSKRASHPPAERNAIVKMTRVIDALERWAELFEEERIYQSETGPILPKVNVGAIEGGAPYRPNYFPGVCSIYLDVRTPPGLRPVTVQHEVEEVLRATGIAYDLEVYKSLLGHEGRGVEPLVESLGLINEYLFHTKLQTEESGRASIWTDTNIYNEMGIPAVKFGPRGKRIHRYEELAIDTMVKAAQVYALVALDICSRPR